MNTTMPTYLLSIRGTLSNKSVDTSRTLHNQTAGSPQNVAAAQSLGDLSHMVYVPIDQQNDEAGEFLILDLWNRMDGLNQFFANPQVQEQANRIFSQRDPVVWSPAAGFTEYHYPAPFGKDDRIVGIVRGMVKSRDDARTVHNALVESLVNKARLRGNMSHDVYFRLSMPGEAESLELFAVDVWNNGKGMDEHYNGPEFQSAFSALFAAQPSATVWTHPRGEWVEW